MQKDLILTCDAGTSGVKCSVFTSSGAMLAAARASYPTDFPRPGWAEQSPERILEATEGCIRELLQQLSPERIACVGLSGTMNGCIPCDETGRALYPNIIHSDSRSQAEVSEIAEVIAPSDFYRLTGNRPDSHYTLPKIMWIRRHHPSVYSRARWWLNTKDYLYAHFTSQPGRTDYSDASLTTMLDIAKKRWASELLIELGLDPARMPEIRRGDDVSGKISPSAARATGLIEGTPVAMGGGDGACAARGAGLSEPGAAYSCIGSSAWVSQLTERPVLDAGVRVFNYLDMSGESNHVCGTIQCGADAFNWAVENLLGGKAGDNLAISQAENLARQVAPGAEGVFFLPTLMGERTPYWDPNTRGCLMGFTLYHNKAHIARAVYEGISYALFSCAEVMRECGVPVKSLMLTGGGAASGLWPDMLASVFNVDTRVHMMPGEATSLGAAICAGVGVGIFSSYAQGAAVARARSLHTPNPAWHEAYAKAFPIYATLYERLKPAFDGIAATSWQ